MEQPSLKRPLEEANQKRTGHPTKQAKTSTFFAPVGHTFNTDPVADAHDAGISVCAAPPKSAPDVNAVVYEWRLDRIDPGHPLFHTCYFGQVVRKGMTSEDAFEKRKREHLYRAACKPKDLGLHWAIPTFGEGAFTTRIVETKRLPHEEAIRWANEREIELIAEHGGVMKDREPDEPIRQTFNLTVGGQGDPTSIWQSIEARSKVAWERAQRHLQAFYDDHGHLRVPQDYYSPDGFPLKKTVNRIRSQSHFVRGHPDRLQWLQDRGWVQNELDAKWEDVQLYLQAFYDGHGHLRVPTYYDSPDGFHLGKTMNGIRSRFDFIKDHPDRLQWLQERGWVANERNAKWEDVQLYLQEFFDIPGHGHLRVPQDYDSPDGFHLGQTVAGIRCHFYFIKGHPDRLQWLQDRGWVANVLDAKWEDVKRYLQAYFKENDHLRVPQDYVSPDGFPLGKTVDKIRSKHAYVKGHLDRLQWLQERGWVANERNARWEDVQSYLHAFYDEHQHLRVPRDYDSPDGFHLGQTVAGIRCHFYFIKGHPDRARWLKERGFKMHARNAAKDAERWAKLGVEA